MGRTALLNTRKVYVYIIKLNVIHLIQKPVKKKHTESCIPYSAKVSRHLHFVEWPLKAFR